MSLSPEAHMYQLPNNDINPFPPAWAPTGDEEPVPTYTETYETDVIQSGPAVNNSAPGCCRPTDYNGTWVLNKLDELKYNGEALELPIQQWPADIGILCCLHGFSHLLTARQETQMYIITSFSDAIYQEKTEVVASMLASNFVTLNTTDKYLQTPLIAAVDAGHVGMVRALVHLGAEVDQYGVYGKDLTDSGSRAHNGGKGKMRTPLQVAASKGNLVIVKVLMEEAGADDSLIAPDGQTALRLAVGAGHREVIDYLPARRGGEFLRWKLSHQAAMGRIKKTIAKIGGVIQILFYFIPKFFLYDIPLRVIVIPIRDAAKWAWNNRKKLGGWIKQKIKEIPMHIKKLGKGVWEAIKKAPRYVKAVWEAIKKALRYVKEVGKWLGEGIWKAIKAIPRAVETILRWIGTFLVAAVKALISAATRGASFLHTVLTAVVTFFRDLTLQNVWTAFCDFLSSIFVGIPKVVWAFIKAFGKVSYKVAGDLFGDLGKICWYIVVGIIHLVKWFPQKILEILTNLTRSVGKGIHEIRVWYDPKR